MSKRNRFSNARRNVLRVLPAFVLVFAAAVAAPPALASPLDGPRDAGIVGERVDGYAEIRDESRAGADIRTLVKDINRQRRAYYEKRAGEEGVSPDAIAKIYAKKIYESAPSGWWFHAADGRWVQK